MIPYVLEQILINNNIFDKNIEIYYNCTESEKKQDTFIEHITYLMYEFCSKEKENGNNIKITSYKDFCNKYLKDYHIIFCENRNIFNINYFENGSWMEWKVEEYMDDIFTSFKKKCLNKQISKKEKELEEKQKQLDKIMKEPGYYLIKETLENEIHLLDQIIFVLYVYSQSGGYATNDNNINSVYDNEIIKLQSEVDEIQKEIENITSEMKNHVGEVGCEDEKNLFEQNFTDLYNKLGEKNKDLFHMQMLIDGIQTQYY